jgi:short-chain 2-methylacyl-CoA dehydrogenase
MDFNLSEEHNLIRQTVRDFAEREIRPIAKELDEKAEFSLDLTRKMGEIGLFGINTPVEYGGQGMDTLSYIIAVEELARIDGSQAATIAAHNSLGISPILYYGTEEQKKRYVPQLCTGEKPSGHSASPNPKPVPIPVPVKQLPGLKMANGSSMAQRSSLPMVQLK